MLNNVFLADKLKSLTAKGDKNIMMIPSSRIPSPMPETAGVPSSLSSSPLTNKTVYLLYSEDHPLHIQLTDALANFLKVSVG